MIITRGGVTADFKSFFMSRCAARVSSALEQDVEHEAGLIDGAPQPGLLSRDGDNDFVQMPFVAASGRALADLPGERLAGGDRADHGQSASLLLSRVPTPNSLT